MSDKVYEIITDQIIEQLEKGEIVWKKEWKSIGLPLRENGKEYRGINVFLLLARGYSNPYWLSYKKLTELGCKIKEGEQKKSTIVVYWNWIRKTDENGKEKKIPFLRYYRVWNVSQLENVPKGKYEVKPVNPNFNPIQECETIVEGYKEKPDIKEGDLASYNPKEDYVTMPKREMFTKETDYYSVLFHELGHSTGNAKRLDREGCKEVNFGSQTYSLEELIAEFTSAFLCGKAGIEQKTIENSASYIKGWLKRLKEDKRFIVQACAKAQKSADLILGKEGEKYE